jgi:hypothetical protein
MQLSQMCDLIGLRTYIIKKTPRGKSTAPDPWTHTRDFLVAYAPSADANDIVRLFESEGVRSDVEAVRWLLTHDELVP